VALSFPPPPGCAAFSAPVFPFATQGRGFGIFDRKPKISTESNRGAREPVLRSINNDDAARGVDVFLRPEGTIGFEEYRRDAEDGRGWFPIVAQAKAKFALRTNSAALQSIGAKDGAKVMTVKPHYGWDVTSY
jgi:hypothetical protein